MVWSTGRSMRPTLSSNWEKRVMGKERYDGMDSGSWVMYTIHKAEVKIRDSVSLFHSVSFIACIARDEMFAHLLNVYSQVEKPRSTMKLSHINFVRSPNII